MTNFALEIVDVCCTSSVPITTMHVAGDRDCKGCHRHPEPCNRIMEQVIAGGMLLKEERCAGLVHAMELVHGDRATWTEVKKRCDACGHEQGSRGSP